MPIQIVGTPALSVTRSDSIMDSSPAGLRSGPGMASDAPARNAVYGSPHAIAWNIGTTGMSTSRSVRPRVDVVNPA